MPRLQDVCSREVVFHVVRLDGTRPVYKDGNLHIRGMTRKDLEAAMTLMAQRGIVPAYRPGTLGRILGSLVNDGLVSRQRPLGESMVYYATDPAWEPQDPRTDLLRAPQTARYVSWRKGERKTGYNSLRPKQPRPGKALKSSGPRHIVNTPPTRADDGSKENPRIDWITSKDSPLYIQADLLLRPTGPA